MIMLFNGRSRNLKKRNANKFFVSEEVLPQTIDILKTRSTPIGIELVIGNHKEIELNEHFYGAILQYPAKHGEVYDYTNFIEFAHQCEIKIVVAADLLSLAILKSP